MIPPNQDVVRREVSKLFRDRYRGRFLCVSCLAPFLRALLGTSHTTAQIRRALRKVSKAPGALQYKRSFICDQCGKTTSCLGGE
jgi:hypothetical protein